MNNIIHDPEVAARLSRLGEAAHGILKLSETGIEELGKAMLASPAWRPLLRQQFPVRVMKAVPQFHEQERRMANKVDDQKELIVYAKLFTPDSGWTWYIIEWQPQFDQKTSGAYFCDIHIYCYAHNAAMPECAELGYSALSEIRDLRGPMTLPVERDIHFKPTPLAQIKEDLNR